MTESIPPKISGTQFKKKIKKIVLAFVCLVFLGAVLYMGHLCVEKWYQYQNTLASQSALFLELQNAQQELIEKNQALMQGLSETKQTLWRLQKSNDNSWRKMEAAYRVRLAQLQVLIGDFKTASILLQDADNLLRPFLDNHTKQARAKISEDLMNIKAFTGIDVDGMLAQLNVLSDQINKLSVKNVARHRFIFNKQVTDEQLDSEEGTSNHWRSYLKKAWQEMKSLVRIRHYPAGVKGLLNDQEQRILKERLALEIVMVRLAVVTKNQEAFHASIESVLLIIEKYFDSQGTALKEVIVKALLALQAKSVQSTHVCVTNALPFLEKED